MTSTHDICAAALGASCACGATGGNPCACDPGHYHLSRIARAAQEGRISGSDFASVIWGDVFQGMDTIPDPGAVAA